MAEHTRAVPYGGLAAIHQLVGEVSLPEMTPNLTRGFTTWRSWSDVFCAIRDGFDEFPPLELLERPMFRKCRSATSLDKLAETAPTARLREANEIEHRSWRAQRDAQVEGEADHVGSVR